MLNIEIQDGQRLEFDEVRDCFERLYVEHSEGSEVCVDLLYCFMDILKNEPEVFALGGNDFEYTYNTRTNNWTPIQSGEAISEHVIIGESNDIFGTRFELVMSERYYTLKIQTRFPNFWEIGDGSRLLYSLEMEGSTTLETMSQIVFHEDKGEPCYKYLKFWRGPVKYPSASILKERSNECPYSDITFRVWYLENVDVNRTYEIGLVDLSIYSNKLNEEGYFYRRLYRGYNFNEHLGELTVYLLRLPFRHFQDMDANCLDSVMDFVGQFFPD